MASAGKFAGSLKQRAALSKWTFPIYRKFPSDREQLATVSK